LAASQEGLSSMSEYMEKDTEGTEKSRREEVNKGRQKVN
jgi:hypothetical protein